MGPLTSSFSEYCYYVDCGYISILPLSLLLLFITHSSTLKPSDTEPVALQTCYSQQITIRAMHIDTITVNQHESPHTSWHLYSIYNTIQF